MKKMVALFPLIKSLRELACWVSEKCRIHANSFMKLKDLMQPPKAYLSKRMGKAFQTNSFSWHKALPLPCLFSKWVTDVANPGRGKRKTYSKMTLSRHRRTCWPKEQPAICTKDERNPLVIQSQACTRDIVKIQWNLRKQSDLLSFGFLDTLNHLKLYYSNMACESLQVTNLKETPKIKVQRIVKDTFTNRRSTC